MILNYVRNQGVVKGEAVRTEAPELEVEIEIETKRVPLNSIGDSGPEKLAEAREEGPISTEHLDI